MTSLYPLPQLLLGIAIVLVVSFVANKLDEDRIREHIVENGGKVVEILRAWGAGSRSERAYDVTYMTRQGERVKARCRTNMWKGVLWINDRPPGTLAGDSPANEVSSDKAELFQCLNCHNIIPSGIARCPQCGWRYK